MLEINKTLPRGDIYPAELVSKGLPPILFDIETTGLGAKTAYIYLIGALEIKRDRLVFRQWFAEGPADEKLLIESFLSWLPDRSCLISFNGRGFDVPFIVQRCKHYDIPCFLPQMPDVDLYRVLAPLKNYFNMSSRRLVAYEKLIGLEREDKYNGGELIEVYKEYVGKKKFAPKEAESLKEMLLLHNEEDITDMVPVMNLLTFIDLINGNFTSAGYSSVGSELVLEIEGASDFPLTHSRIIATLPQIPQIKVSTCGRRATVHVPVLNCRLKHYFNDYKDYYYLPEEDMAIHKSIASSVSPDHRVQATKSTAFSYAETEFIPQFSKLQPEFKQDINDITGFLPLSELNSEEKIKTYIKGLFK